MGLIEYSSSIDWEQESFPSPEDFKILPLFALFFLVRLFLDRFVFVVKLKALYMYAAGSKTRRADFGVSMTHHVASVILIVLSYIFRFVLAIHDGSDVLLEIGKMSKYSGMETVASIAFVIFVLSLILLRLIYYPFWR